MTPSLSSCLTENIQLFHKLLPLDDSFDFITRQISLGNTNCYFISINGMCDLEILQFLFSNIKEEDFLSLNISDTQKIPDIIKDHFTYAQITFSDSVSQVLQSLLAGPSVLLIDGYCQAAIIDTRKYPSRSLEEPDTEKVIKGAGDGFIETLLTNCNLLRRRIRSKDLVFSLHTIGSVSSTDVAVCYLKNCCDHSLLHKLEATLDTLQVSCLTMGIHSLKELLIKKSYFHPLPVFFLTSRPDVAASYVAEGYLLVLVDNSPFAMVLPCNLFQFTQSPEDYYKSPVAGTYFRLLRFLCLLISLFLLPGILYFSYHPNLLPLKLHGLLPQSSSSLALFIHLLFVEFGLDLFKYTSSHSASGYSSSLGLIGGLLIGDMAVNLQWTNIHLLFYGAFTLLSGLAISTVELSDAIKIYRLCLLLLIGFLPDAGLWFGLFFLFFSMATTPVYGKKSYFWPLFPLSFKSLKTLFFRRPTFQVQPERKKAP
ncbi:MAG: spore germination protein [Lachnospiraceae bacterium]|nr:spore germination protein [Lachnospiraceae bacterium]